MYLREIATTALSSQIRCQGTQVGNPIASGEKTKQTMKKPEATKVQTPLAAGSRVSLEVASV